MMYKGSSGQNLKGKEQNKGLIVPLLHASGPAKGPVLTQAHHKADLIDGAAWHSPGGRSLLWQPHPPALWLGCDTAQ